MASTKITASLLEDMVKNLETECGLLDKLDDLENRSRRNNICFDAIPESDKETWAQTEEKIKEVISSKLKIKTKGIVIERAHRIGKKKRADKPRTAIARFLNHKDKQAILVDKKNLKGTGFVREDYSDLVMAKAPRTDTQAQCEARDHGHIRTTADHPIQDRDAERNEGASQNEQSSNDGNPRLHPSKK